MKNLFSVLIAFLIFSIIVFLTSYLSCDNRGNRFRRIIEEDFNFCSIDEDCGVGIGMCHMGCFFIVNKEKIEKINEMRDKLSKMNCNDCVICCEIPPEKLACIENKCYPDISDRYFALFIHGDCEKLIEMYGDRFIGKSIGNLYIDYSYSEEIKIDSLHTVFKFKAGRLKNLELLIDENYVIESVLCSNSGKSFLNEMSNCLE